MTNIEKHFGSVIALAGVTVEVFAGECRAFWAITARASRRSSKRCQAHKPTAGTIEFEGKPMNFGDPRDAIGRDRAVRSTCDDPPASVYRNFFGATNPSKGLAFRSLTGKRRATMDAMKKMGINLRGPIRPLAPCPAVNARRSP